MRIPNNPTPSFEMARERHRTFLAFSPSRLSEFFKTDRAHDPAGLSRSVIQECFRKTPHKTFHALRFRWGTNALESKGNVALFWLPAEASRIC
eukprot:4210851-Pyramimonas_sp.AAC.2